ncbi:hypothetical protein QRD89_01625 [Halobacillus sp. ACCC02827]|uniref:hypothetical protein n=1 Tax=Bacillaceae TaxID=186817 RepID=UPI0002A4F7E3|nr:MULTISPECIES: hypothetical protein [Bacillaceae]ELK46680.1 hypothetical protein D479_09856 [Halobacillus sp. BAB-2008]QHT45308.1 hypothetical protein M662_01740 [Bacillus sp. SB49]WJE16091.1 hypothetical protein QRD89_01625 [Halobacillus sp. ACCC02827]
MNNKPKKQKEQETSNEAAELFNKKPRLDKAFAPDEEKQAEDHSESDALFHHYSDKESK